MQKVGPDPGLGGPAPRSGARGWARPHSCELCNNNMGDYKI